MTNGTNGHAVNLAIMAASERTEQQVEALLSFAPVVDDSEGWYFHSGGYSMRTERHYLANTIADILRARRRPALVVSLSGQATLFKR